MSISNRTPTNWNFQGTDLENFTRPDGSPYQYRGYGIHEYSTFEPGFGAMSSCVTWFRADTWPELKKQIDDALNEAG